MKRYLVLLMLGSLFAFGCSDDSNGSNSSTNGDTDSNSDNNGGTDSSTDVNNGSDPDGTDPDGTDSGWHSSVCVVTGCEGTVWQCGNCIDDDSDGLVDSQDPDCLGPCDNNESGFMIDIPGSAPGNCDMDCYFDDNNGGGDDECIWDFRCDEDDQHYKVGNENAVCTYEPETVTNPDCDGLRAEQTEQCNNFCEPLVPNGCDCWGCCEIARDDTDNPYRFIGTPGCTLETLENCDPCTPVPSCENTCGECELCIGMTELPPECLDDNNRCPDGVQACGQAGDDPCPEGTYCITGCCISSSVIVPE
ncbi:MAG: hypothetical protein JXX29_24165 [Deltaproteobacteria bacterium]|nr:hypothetical protein [Deltaproteobacteria bacterium]MBN2674798.1 hypothetical protein [Deltaproteobacteria bacterium]